MKRLNIKFIAILLVSMLIVGVSVHFLHAYHVGKTGRLLLNRAEQAEKDGETAQAIKYYRLYHQQAEEGDTQGIRKAAELALAELDKPAADGRDFQRAYQFLEMALREEPDNNQLRREYIEMLVTRGNDTHKGLALTEIEELMTVDPVEPNDDNFSNDPQLIYWKAVASEALKKEKETEEALGRLIGFDPNSAMFGRFTALEPDNLEAYVLLAKFMWESRGRQRLADEIINRMVEQNSDNGRAYVMRSGFKRAFMRGTSSERDQRLAAANDDIRTAYRKSPADADVVLETALLELREDNMDRAIELLKRGLQTHPDDARFVPLLAQAMFQSGRSDEAIQFAQKGLKEQPKNGNLLYLLFNLQVLSGELDGAQESVDQMRKQEFVSSVVAVSQARVDLRRGKVREAAKQLEEARKQVDRAQGLLRWIDHDLALAYRALGQTDMQQATYERWLKYEPGSETALRGLADTQRRRGKFIEAMATLDTLGNVIGQEKFLADSRLPGFYLNLAEAQLEGEPDNESLKRRVENLRGIVKQNVAPKTEMQQQVESVNESLREEDVDEAIAKLEKLIADNPDNQALQFNLIRLHAKRDGAAAGLATLDGVKQQFGDSPQLRLLEIVLWMNSQEPVADEQVERLVSDIDDFTENQQYLLLTNFGAIWQGKQDPQLAREFWEAAQALNPNELSAYQRLFDLARQANDANATRLIVADIKEQFGDDSSEYQAAQVQVLIDEAERGEAEAADLEQARELVEELRERRPNWHRPLTLLGDIERLSGNPTAAVTNYLEALDSGAADAETIRRTATLLMQQNRFQEGREVLDRLGSDQSEQTKRLKLASDIETGNAEQAMQVLAEMAPEDSTDVNDWLWRGQVLRKLEKNDEAEAAFRKAIELSPNATGSWNALVEHLVAAGQRGEAEQVVRDAEIRLPEDASTQLLANCYAMLGNVQLAEHYLQKALHENPDDMALQRSLAAFFIRSNQLAKARNQLSKMALQKSERVERSNLPHVHWARRALAELTAPRQGDYPQFLQAVSLVNRNEQDGELAVDDLRTLAVLHGRREEPRSTNASIDYLEQIGKRRELNPQEQMLKAQMLNRRGDWASARRIMTELLSENQPTPQLLAAYARMLIDREDPRQASKWVNDLAKLVPDAPEVIQMKAEILIKLNRGDRAADLLNEWIDQAESDDTENKEQQIPRVRVAAGLLERYDEDLHARDMYERLVRLQPDADLAMLAFAARAGNVAAAFEKLDERFNQQTALSLLGLAVSVTRERPGDFGPQQRELIEGWFEQARQMLPGDRRLDLEWANYNDVINNYDETVETYRRILQSDLTPSQRGMIANNLAFKLALNNESLAEALQLVETAIDSLGPSSALLDTRGMVYLQMRQADKAIADFEEAVSTSNSGDLYFHLALGYQAAGDVSKADAAITEARLKGFEPLKLDPLSRAMHDRLIDWLTN